MGLIPREGNFQRATTGNISINKQQNLGPNQIIGEDPNQFGSRNLANGVKNIPLKLQSKSRVRISTESMKNMTNISNT